MPLAKQITNISLTNGIDTKTDEKLVQGPNLLELENAVFTKLGRLSKRFGYEVLPKEIAGGGEIQKGEALGLFNDELNMYTGTKILSYADSSDVWVQKGDVVSAIVKQTPVVKNGYEQSNPTMDVKRNIACYAWDDSRGGSRYSVVDISSNTVISYDMLLDTNAKSPRVTAFGEYFLIWYAIASDTSLRYKAIPINDPSQIGPSILFTTDMSAASSHSEVVNGDKVFVVYSDDTATTSIRTLDSSFVISSVTTFADTSDVSLDITADSDQSVWIVYHNGTDLNVTVYNFLLTLELGITVIETIPNSLAVGYVDGGAITVWYSQIDSSNTQDHVTRINSVLIDGTVGAPKDFLRSVCIASRPFFYNDQCYINLLHESELQSTYFTANVNGSIIAKMSPDTGGVSVTSGQFTDVPQISDSTFIYAHQEKTAIETQDSKLFSTKGVYASEINFSSENKFQNAQLGQLHIVGGVLQSYDGASVTEHNFHLYPEGIKLTPIALGGNIGDGTFAYQVCYEWTDNLGQIHRSTPSIPESVTLSGGGNHKISLEIPTLRLTSKTDNRTPVRIVIYRTEADGTVYYRVTSITSPIYNSLTADSITYTDDESDSDIIFNDPIYNTGGVLDNSPPPPCSLVKTFKNRVFVSGLPDPLEFWYSKIRSPNYPVEFTNFFRKRVDSFGGPITAIEALDANFLIFKKQAIFLIAGDGPNDLGGGVDYGDPQLVTTDVGCDNPNSIVITPNGIMFQSTKGIYLINRSLQASYVGSRVELYNNLDISGAALVPDTNQVRFTTSEGTTLMYDYLFDQWSVFTNQVAEDCDIFDGRFIYLRANGQVWKENDTYTDDNLPIPLKITTNWISLAGLQGFQRIYRMIFLGDYKTAHRLLVSIGYDFNPNFEQFATVDVADVYPLTAYGQDSPYGKDASRFGYGGGYPLYQFKTHLTKQKCTSIRFSFEDSQTNETTFGEAFNMTNLALEVGVKGTLRKYDAGNSYGTS